MKASEWARRQLIQDILNRMTDEEQRAYYLLNAIDNGQNEVMSALRKQDGKLDEIKKKQSWLNDFSANIAANAAFDTLTYIGAKIIGKIK